MNDKELALLPIHFVIPKPAASDQDDELKCEEELPSAEHAIDGHDLYEPKSDDEGISAQVHKFANFPEIASAAEDVAEVRAAVREAQRKKNAKKRVEDEAIQLPNVLKEAVVRRSQRSARIGGKPARLVEYHSDYESDWEY